jgi:mannan endo-1,4-beta-mannosidase
MRFSSDYRLWQASPAARLLAPALVLALSAVGTAVYLSPTGPSGAETRKTVASLASPTGAAGTSPYATSPSASASSAKPTASPTKPVPGRVPVSIVRPPTKAQIIRQYFTTVVHSSSSPSAAPSSSAAPTSAPPVASKVKHCWDFHFQQDAQDAYLANLSDPAGLDGDPGPYNGDGLACSQLPVDPNRAASIPIAAYTAPALTTGTKLALSAPKLNYFGVAQDGLPNSTPMYNTVDTQLGKAPSAVEWFTGWDTDFDPSRVQSAWTRGALPVMTWVSKPEQPDSTANPADYSLTKILNGSWDDYLYKFAGDIVRTNLPVVIRFDHEMNGNWYPWAAGQTAWNNSPAKYTQVWQYVWNIFQKVGANNDVIWLWSPGRIDNVRPTTAGNSDIAADYPGDAYVDWVGATVYLRTSKIATDYSTSFGKTVSKIRSFTSKPLFFAEVGAIQTDAGVDVTATKSQWIANTIAGFLADPSVVGFVWFNNIATTQANGGPITNDWRFDSSADALAAFKSAISDARFSSGVMPDSAKG